MAAFKQAELSELMAEDRGEWLNTELMWVVYFCDFGFFILFVTKFYNIFSEAVNYKT